MKKRNLLFIITLCFLLAGCGKGGDSSTQGSINENDLKGDLSDDVSSGTRTVDCHLCHGDGSCYHCDGEGFRGGRRCSVCNGTGDCDACGGFGSLEVFEIDGMDYTVCTSCHGRGVCGVCNGVGKIEQHYSTLGSVNSNCSLCHGSGMCLGCKGTGLSKLAGF